ncbi:hypothetical protein Q9R46_00450 [Paenibacillus sp. RRE4]|uniref:hypothetical protein n=1 Tax=Paenibacillus sp. RRE4 TaxID=2962587 RepID=UPI002881659C|nr:hypothetical protein [Paenibacillus sp. RRE4]MDT0121094.1 hypothetical protein [Paenibacillus sp. RRE4]
MATAFVLVEENSKIPIDRLVRDVQQACREARLHIFSGIQDVDSEQNLKHGAFGISFSEQEVSDLDTVNNTIRVDVYDELAPYQYIELEWREDGRVYFNTLMIDEVYQNEEITLIFLYHFLTRYPQMMVWMEEDWVYTLSDLEKALKTSKMSDWCYVNPNSL